jgi:type 1 glutamine amidotransferase
MTHPHRRAAQIAFGPYRIIVVALALAGIFAGTVEGQGRGPDWSRIRTAVTAIFGWKLAVPLSAFPEATFFEALEKQNALFLRNVEASSTQKVSADIPKNLDHHLTPAELEAVQKRLRAMNQRLVAYQDLFIGDSEEEDRKVFAFAKSLNIETLIASPPPTALPMIDKLAAEFEINIAILNRGRDATPWYADPAKLLQSIQSRSSRIGVCVDTGSWMEAGIKPVEGLVVVSERLMAVRLRDRSALGHSGRDVILGAGSGGLQDFIETIYRSNRVPSFVAVAPGTAATTMADLSKSYDWLEQTLQPLAAAKVAEIGRITPIRGPERMRPQDRDRSIAAIHAAVPTQAQAKPKKPRKLLVMDLNVAYPGHGSIPAANLAIELWGKKTGAYQAVFSNDLDNLKYPRIKEFDAVFLNNTVGQIFPDPNVRAGLMRFIQEGGGLGGYHGTPHASIDWTEFGDMLAARAGSHRSPDERVIVKIDDPTSPLTAAFEGREFEFFDEFYRFTSPPYSREKVHVLLSFNTEKTDLHQLPNCDICVRADNDYPIAWIRGFDKGRIFYTTVGHNSTVFESPAMAKFFLAGIQFILGDLEADTTPSMKK